MTHKIYRANKAYIAAVAIVVIAVLAVAGIAWKKRAGDNSSTQGQTTGGQMQLVSPDTEAASKAASNASEKDVSTKSFGNPDPEFAFQYPSALSAGSFEEGDGQTVLVQDKAQGTVLQLYVNPFDETGPVTPQRIHKDLPDVIINKSQNLQIAGEQALAFETKENNQDAEEVWFVHDKNLFRFTVPLSQIPLLQQVLNSWTF